MNKNDQVDPPREAKQNLQHPAVEDPSAHERRQLYRELAQSAQEIRLLDNVLAAVSSVDDQDELIRTVGFGIKSLLPYERWSRVGLALLDDQQRQLLTYQVAGEQSNPYWNNIGKGIQAAARDLGVETTYALAGMASGVTQEMLIDQAIRDHISGIALAPIDAVALEPAIQRARRAGIPVVTFDTPPAEQSQALVYIGTDNVLAGRLAGQAIVQLLPQGGEVGIGVRRLEVMNTRQRLQGFLAAVEGTAITPLSPFESDIDRERALQLSIETLVAHPNTAGAFGVGSLNGPAWGSAVSTAGRNGKVKVVCFDTLPATIAMLKEGTIHAAVAQREHAMGYRSVQILSQMVTGGVEATLARLPASRFVDTGVDLVTLECSSWSIALADYLKRSSQLKADREEQAAVVRHSRPIKLLLIGLLMKADPNMTKQTASLEPDSLIGQVVASIRSVVANPFLPAIGSFAEARDRGVRTLVGVPLLAERGVVGVLTLESQQEDACSAGDLATIERIANMVVVVLENARLFRQTGERRRELEQAAQRQDLLLQTILDLSSPVASIVPGLLVMPLVGMVDTNRAGRFMETLLQTIQERQAQVVLIDITGVPVVDTIVANSIIRAAQSARLLGAEVVLVGISPAVAQTIVQLGIELSQITTRADLESGFSYALSRLKGRVIYQ